jgi:hypothetical protein
MPPGGLSIQAVGGGPHPLAPCWIKPQPPGRPVGAGLPRVLFPFATHSAYFFLATKSKFEKYENDRTPKKIGDVPPPAFPFPYPESITKPASICLQN